VVGRLLLLAVLVFRLRNDRSLAGIDVQIELGWEIRPPLNVVIGDKLEDAVLREDGRFIVERTVFEVECEAGGDTIAADDLDEVAVGKDLPLLCCQREKTVERPFGVANPYRLGDRP